MFGWLEMLWDYNNRPHNQSSRKGHKSKLARDKARRRKHQKRYGKRRKRH